MDIGDAIQTKSNQTEHFMLIVKLRIGTSKKCMLECIHCVALRCNNKTSMLQKIENFTLSNGLGNDDFNTATQMHSPNPHWLIVLIG